MKTVASTSYIPRYRAQNTDSHPSNKSMSSDQRRDTVNSYGFSHDGQDHRSSVSYGLRYQSPQIERRQLSPGVELNTSMPDRTVRFEVIPPRFDALTDRVIEHPRNSGQVQESFNIQPNILRPQGEGAPSDCNSQEKLKSCESEKQALREHVATLTAALQKAHSTIASYESEILRLQTELSKITVVSQSKIGRLQNLLKDQLNDLLLIERKEQTLQEVYKRRVEEVAKLIDSEQVLDWKIGDNIDVKLSQETKFGFKCPFCSVDIDHVLIVKGKSVEQGPSHFRTFDERILLTPHRGDTAATDEPHHEGIKVTKITPTQTLKQQNNDTRYYQPASRQASTIQTSDAQTNRYSQTRYSTPMVRSNYPSQNPTADAGSKLNQTVVGTTYKPASVDMKAKDVATNQASVTTPKTSTYLSNLSSYKKETNVNASYLNHKTVIASEIKPNKDLASTNSYQVTQQKSYILGDYSKYQRNTEGDFSKPSSIPLASSTNVTYTARHQGGDSFVNQYSDRIPTYRSSYQLRSIEIKKEEPKPIETKDTDRKEEPSLAQIPESQAAEEKIKELETIKEKQEAPKVITEQETQDIKEEKEFLITSITNLEQLSKTDQQAVEVTTEVTSHVKQHEEVEKRSGVEQVEETAEKTLASAQTTNIIINNTTNTLQVTTISTEVVVNLPQDQEFHCEPHHKITCELCHMELKAKIKAQEDTLNAELAKEQALQTKFDSFRAEMDEKCESILHLEREINKLKKLVEVAEKSQDFAKVLAMQEELDGLRGQLEELKTFMFPARVIEGEFEEEEVYPEESTQANDITPANDTTDPLTLNKEDSNLVLTQTQSQGEQAQEPANGESKQETKAKKPRRVQKHVSVVQEQVTKVEDARIKALKERVKNFIQTLKDKGLRECGLILGIDCTASNIFTGRRSFGGRHLHDISNRRLNFYEEVISILGGVVNEFTPGGRFPVYLFGDDKTRDRSVRPLYTNKAGTSDECQGIEHVLAEYRKKIVRVGLSGPTSFKPLIDKAIEITKAKADFHVLIIIGDGAVSDLQETVSAIVEASHYPIAIIMIGVGDGDFKQYPNDPWKGMKKLDDMIPHRKFDNFNFLPFDSKMLPEEFAELALNELHEAYQFCVENNMIEQLQQQLEEQQAAEEAKEEAVDKVEPLKIPGFTSAVEAASSQKKGDRTPSQRKGGSTPSNRKGDITPSLRKGDSTPSLKKGDITPSLKKGDTTPSLKKVDSTPSQKEANEKKVTIKTNEDETKETKPSSLNKETTVKKETVKKEKEVSSEENPTQENQGGNGLTLEKKDSKAEEKKSTAKKVAKKEPKTLKKKEETDTKADQKEESKSATSSSSSDQTDSKSDLSDSKGEAPTTTKKKVVKKVAKKKADATESQLTEAVTAQKDEQETPTADGPVKKVSKKVVKKK